MHDTANATETHSQNADALARGTERLRALPPGRREVVEAAAVLDPISSEALTALIEAPGRGALEQLRVAGLIVEEQGRQRLDEGLRLAVLGALERQPERLVELHARAAQHFGTALDQGEPEQRAALEAAFIRHFEGQGEALARIDPAGLLALAESAPLARLERPGSRQLVRYFGGLGTGLCGNLDGARAQLAALLAEPNLEVSVEARAENSCALFAQAQGDGRAARAGFERSLAIWERLEVRPRQVGVLLSLGGFLHESGEFAEAEQRLLAGAERAAEAGMRRVEAQARYQLGQLQRDRGRWADALEAAQRASELFVAEHDPDQQARCSLLCGEVELLRGELDGAAGWFAMAIGEMRSRRDEAEIWVNMGLLCQAEGNHVDALDRFETALAAAEGAGRSDLLALIDYRMGVSQEQLGNDEAALAHYIAATARDQGSAARAGGMLAHLLGGRRLACEAALSIYLARGDATAAFDYAERARSLATRPPQEVLSAHEVGARLPADTRLLAFYASGLLGGEAALVEALPRLPSSLRDALTPTPRLVRMLLGGPAGPRAELCQLDPHALRAVLRDSSELTRTPGPAMQRHLYETLIAPLDDELDGMARLVVVPHGPLEGLDFAALADAEGLTLGARVGTITYAPSAAELDRSGLSTDRADFERIV
jgi:tetratricopeptide (TPR) repeat protein